MPHSTNSSEPEGSEDMDFNNVMRALNNMESNAFDFEFMDRDLEIGEKADDAVDYEDFSDDDLPEEEPANIPARFPAHDAAARDPSAEPDADEAGLFGDDDIFGGGDDGNQDQGDNLDDLFGEEPESPQPAGQVDEQQDLFEDEPLSAQPAELPSGLETEPASQAMSVDEKEFPENASVSSEEEMDSATLRQWKLQLALLSRTGVPQSPPENNEEILHELFPSFDRVSLPRWLELVPHKKAFFRGKQPLKVPKPVLPTKVNIELAPDQERMFRTGQSNKRGLDSEYTGLVFITESTQEEQKESQEEPEIVDIDENETLPGGVTMNDIRVFCANWTVKDDIPTLEPEQPPAPLNVDPLDDDMDWLIDTEHPSKKQKTGPSPMDVLALVHHDIPLLDDPLEAAKRVAKKVVIDMNDAHLLLEERQVDSVVHKPKHNIPRTRDEMDVNLTRRLTNRYNISNDQAYDMLKQNHQNKIRSTLGNVTLEHAMPALRLQWPYYKTELLKNEARSFHRPSLSFKPGNTSWFKNPVHLKRKQQKGKDAKALYGSTSALSMADNSNVLLVEYSEEAPMSLSNFGMCNRFINYYRRKNPDDPTRPRAEIGETAVLLPQDKSPFSIFGYVDPGEIVPAISNSMYRAPLYPHQAKSTDFLVIRSSTASKLSSFYIRNIENFYVAGQQFPSVDIPGPHSRKVTTVAKNRMKMLVYRLLKKSPDERLAISDVTAHIPNTTDMQNRQKVKDFLQHDKDTKYWKPLDPVLPDQDTIRSWVSPEDVCLLESMQVGQQHLNDTGHGGEADNANDNDEDEEGESFEKQMAPWKASRNFLLASQGKAMLKLHGEGDPTGRGEGFSFIKTSMKGGFKAVGESVEDKLDAQRLKELGGHSYNVARQQKSYETSIRKIWDAQKSSLSSTVEHSDDESDVDHEGEEEFNKPTPRSEAPTPAAFRRDDETASQFSRLSFSSQKNKVLRITRQFKASNGEIVQREQLVWDPRVIRHYMQHRHRSEAQTTNLDSIRPTGDPEVDARNRKLIETELNRLNRNKERRFAREKQKGISRAGDSPADGKPTGTQRKCANCGQQGHIKTNKKLCPLLNGQMKPEDRVTDSAFSMSAPGL